MKKNVSKPKKIMRKSAIEEIQISAKEKESLCNEVVLKMRPIIAELDLWRKNSMNASIRL